MKAQELLPKNTTVYVDMDGVLADLFNHVGELHDVEHYNRMTKDQWEEFFKTSNAYELFRGLPAFPTANKLLSIVTQFAGGYKILSSPLSFDKAGSIKGKKEWLQKHIHVDADGWIFEHNKAMYAKNPDGTPNILIDDYGVNIRAWQQAGGIAIKYQADEDSLQKVFKELQAAARQAEATNNVKTEAATGGAAAMGTLGQLGANNQEDPNSSQNGQPATNTAGDEAELAKQVMNMKQNLTKLKSAGANIPNVSQAAASAVDTVNNPTANSQQLGMDANAKKAVGSLGLEMEKILGKGNPTQVGQITNAIQRLKQLSGVPNK